MARKLLLGLCALLALTLNVSAGQEFYTLRTNQDGSVDLVYSWPAPATVYSMDLCVGDNIVPGREMAVFDFQRAEGVPSRNKATFRNGLPATVTAINIIPSQTVKRGDVLFSLAPKPFLHDSKVVRTRADGSAEVLVLPGWGPMLVNLWKSTGLYDVISETCADFTNTWQLGIGRVLMFCVGLLLIYLAVFKDFEPLLLLPIGFGAILANIPLAGIAGPDGILGIFYHAGIETGLFPLLIFMGVGAMTDFGPMIANPKTALMGGGAQFGIFFALLGALVLSKFGFGFTLKDAASIGIIGGADGPTAIYLTSKLSPHLLGAIAVAAYSYMALVPIIQPPIMRLLTTKKDRMIRMEQLRPVSKLEKICFPVLITLLCAVLLPSAAPLIGMLMFGNLMRECGVVDRLSDTTQNALINTVTIFLGLTVGSKLSADKFLNLQTLGILVLGVIAFAIGTAGGILIGQLMKVMSGGKINPLIGAAGVSAVPMSARVVNKVGLEDDPHNFLLMHAMGPNVSGVIGSAVAAGVLLKACELLHIAI